MTCFRAYGVLFRHSKILTKFFQNFLDIRYFAENRPTNHFLHRSHGFGAPGDLLRYSKIFIFFLLFFFLNFLTFLVSPLIDEKPIFIHQSHILGAPGAFLDIRKLYTFFFFKFLDIRYFAENRSKNPSSTSITCLTPNPFAFISKSKHCKIKYPTPVPHTGTESVPGGQCHSLILLLPLINMKIHT